MVSVTVVARKTGAGSCVEISVEDVSEQAPVSEEGTHEQMWKIMVLKAVSQQGGFQ